ncbi:molybdopterin-dependent oxidoreductase [Litchfieldia salsa]|uniref:Anaerobic selenocysteine-containing dehydrogenase n=1 Tax=Litchfieldia salsa TaxID=930152 RepID=A0A1H0UES9_9BACI|nr:molybdopterin-dependent oxidoreductase [Litchfieldia salsa]SDP64545.1 Anaerobic selenocysteine-containing dehydrogenase [Litchfieldia salsa]
MGVYKSACPLNCWDNCGFQVEVENGKVKKIDGDPEHPITQGKICGRGRMLEARTNSDQRLLYPLKKVDGKFHRITWEQALIEIADKMVETKTHYGSTSVLHSHDYSNSGLLKNLDKRFFNLFGGVTELTGSICWGSGIEAQKWDFGNALSHSPDDLDNSRNIVIWGRNVARTNMHLFQRLSTAKKNGAKIIVIDPLFNATAKIANSYISVKPGMDGILAIGIMKEMIRLNLQNHQFIEQYTHGYSDLLDLLNTITINEVEAQTDVPRETITQLAKIYSNGPTTTLLGLGMQRYVNGGNTIRLIDALIAISGNIGIPGGGANYASLQVGQSFDIDKLALPDRKLESRSFTMMQQAEGILESINPKIKMIFVTCGNPLTQVPNTNLVKKAFQSVETVVVIEQFMTDTAELADYVLPTATAFEEEDVYYSSMYHHYVNYGPKIVSSPGEVQSDLWIWTELAKRLGFGEEFNYTREEWIEMGLGDLKDKNINLEALRRHNHMPLPVDDIPWSDFRFSTPTGKYEFTSNVAESKGYDGRLKVLYPEESSVNNRELSEKFPYTLLSIHPMRSNHSQNYHLIDQLQTIRVEVSKDIAEEIGLHEDDWVRVFNDRGELKGQIRILKQAHSKTVNIDEGQWSRYGGSVNLLTPNRVSDNGQGSTLYDCLVNIEKV